jgi:hypothetical protein
MFLVRATLRADLFPRNLETASAAARASVVGPLEGHALPRQTRLARRHRAGEASIGQNVSGRSPHVLSFLSSAFVLSSFLFINILERMG